MIPSPVNLSTVPPYRCTTAAQRSARSAMISRSRSAPTAAAMSIECTTSANNTVTCLYSADWVACASRAPHSLQNLAVALNSVPHELQDGPTAVRAPRPCPPSSTSIWCHRCSDNVCQIDWRSAPKPRSTRRHRHHGCADPLRRARAISASPTSALVETRIWLRFSRCSACARWSGRLPTPPGIQSNSPALASRLRRCSSGSGTGTAATSRWVYSVCGLRRI